MQIRTKVLSVLLFHLVFLAGIGAVDAAEEMMEVTLPCTSAGWYDQAEHCQPEVINIPKGRPIYALLVSGFHQNRNLDMFHWFDFAKYLQEHGAYVHYAWWNNLLAPYMERPLHYTGSVPSTGPIPWHDNGLFRIGDSTSTWGWDDPRPYPTKAIPADDHQFQQDARTLLQTIREHNPTAKIILVGHSMGGSSVVRLADSMPVDFVIDLLAPIDPVGNRTCIENCPGIGVNAWTSTCWGMFTFTRWRAIRIDAMDRSCNPLDPDPFYPPKREFDWNIGHLYHRWQQESTPPYDFSCPAEYEEENFLEWPCGSAYPYEDDYLFDHPDTRVTGINQGSVNVQSIVDTAFDSGKDVPVPFGNFGGTFDGHGEIVGFRGFLLGGAFDTFDEWLTYLIGEFPVSVLGFESYPVGLMTEGDWPQWDESDPDRDANAQARVEILKAWEKDPFYLYKKGYEPWNPGLCMVSRDLSNILDTLLPQQSENLPPTADAGSGLTVSVDENCIGHASLDGSESSDPEEDDLTYTWTWNDGANEATGPTPTIELPLGDTVITLVVNDGELDSEPDTVEITVVDVTPPVIVLHGEADMVLECGVDTWEDPGATATDNCDPDVPVIVGGHTVDPEVPGTEGLTYDAEDESGNAAVQVIRTVVVQDTIPPTIDSVTASPSSLWPPNHKLVPVRLRVVAWDYCDADPDIMLVSVTNSEPDDAPGGGDGHTTRDIRDAGIGTEDYGVFLRAERQGGGSGRVYTIKYSATDDTGNGSVSGTHVVVGHDQSGLPETGQPRLPKNGKGRD